MSNKIQRLARLVLPVVLLSSLLFVMVMPASAAGPVIHVHAGQSIQSAIDGAPDGAKIIVHSGTYAEMVTVSKPLQLLAAGQVTIDATDQANGVKIADVDGSNSRVLLKGFTVENAKFSGVVIYNSAYVLLSNNTIQNNDQALVLPTDETVPPSCPGLEDFPLLSFDCGEGVNLNGASYTMLFHNVVQGNFGGVLLSDELGPTHHNVLSHNQVINNREECGITLASHPGYGTTLESLFTGVGLLPGNGIHDNLIIKNISNGNGGAGIGVFAATPGTANYNNTVIANDVNDNGMPGITVHSHTPDQNVNGNRFLNNRLSGNGWGGDEDIGLVPSLIGIEIFANGDEGAAPITGTVASGNRIENEEIGVWVGANVSVASIHVNGNWLGGTTIGVQNLGTDTLDATLNHWGCPAGPASPDCASVVGPVNFTPWIP